MLRSVLIGLIPLVASSLVSAEPSRKDFKVRASEIDPQAKPHPEIGFDFGTPEKPLDLEHASVDPQVQLRGKLVIWLMGHNQGLFDRLAADGFHAIQVHYANGWFTKFYSAPPPADDLYLSKIRLEAATGIDSSPLLQIDRADSIMGRSLSLVKWLQQQDPGSNWKQFLNEQGTDLRWDQVILCGISHGSTTAARLAKHIRVDRVVMFSGPRDQLESWQSLPSATPANRYFAFTHILDDGWQNDHYCRSWLMLGLHAFGPVVDVDDTPAPYGNSRRLITHANVNQDAKRAHGAVVPGSGSPKDASGAFLYEPVWHYLFTHPIDQVGSAVEAESDCRMNQREPVR